MRFDIHIHPGPETVELLRRIERALGNQNEKLEFIMIDTKAILKAVEDERTTEAGWKAMNSAKDKIIADLRADLATATANQDPAALAQVQADLDKAANDLSADNADAAAAIAANVATPAAPAAPII